MDPNKNGGHRIMRRIEDLLRSSTLPPQAVLTIMRAAGSDAGIDPLKEIERLQHRQRGRTGSESGVGSSE